MPFDPLPVFPHDDSVSSESGSLFDPDDTSQEHSSDATSINEDTDQLEVFLRSYSEETDGLAFIVEEMYESFFVQPRSSMGIDPTHRDPFNMDRDTHVKCYHVIAPRSDSFHVFRDLCQPHYTLDKSSIRRRLSEQCPESGRAFYLPDTSYGPPVGTLTGDPLGFVNVWRNVSTDSSFQATTSTAGTSGTSPSLHDPVFQAYLVEQVLRFGTGDGRRGNRYIDVGLCGDESTTRRGDPHGLAHPNTRAFPVGCDVAAIQAGFVELSHMSSNFFNPVSTPER